MMRTQQLYQIGRKCRGEVLVTICDVRNEVNVLSQCLDGGGVGGRRVGNEDRVGRLILIVLVYEVLLVRAGVVLVCCLQACMNRDLQRIPSNLVLQIAPVSVN